jgi:2-oxoglutarate ferredoxin oxidoreductase subunit delta
MSAAKESKTVETRGTVTIDIERCKGCELCIPACKPGVLEMSTARNELGVAFPVLSPGCTGCSACLLVCPDFCFEVYQFESPLHHPIARSRQEEELR